MHGSIPEEGFNVKELCIAVSLILCSTAVRAADLAPFALREGWQVQGLNGLWRSDTDLRVLKCNKGTLRVYLRPDAVSEDGLCLFTKTVSGSLDRSRGLRKVNPDAGDARIVDGMPVLVWSETHDRWERP